jgi:hypothetical protein
MDRQFETLIKRPFDPNAFNFQRDLEPSRIVDDQGRALVPHIASADTLAFYQETVNAPERVNIGLPPAEREYQGSWFYQGLQPTCVVEALRSAALAAGAKIDHQLWLDLHQTANPLSANPAAESGLTKAQVFQILSEHPEAEIRLSSPDQMLRFIPTDDHQFPIETPPLSIFSNPVDAPSKEETRRQKLSENAQIIKDCVSRGQALTIGVLHEEYAPGQRTGFHEVVIAGYKVTPEGNMNVQVIDPARGKLWMSLEHLSSAVIPASDLIVTKANGR